MNKLGSFCTLLFLSMIFISCSKNNPTSSNTDTTSTGTTLTNQAAVEQLLSSNEFLKQEISDMVDESNMPAESSHMLSSSLIDSTALSATAVYPAGWKRSRVSLADVNKNFTFETTGDTVICTATTSRSITGLLYVDTSHDGIINPGHKPLADTISRKMYFEKAPGSVWKLAKFSPHVTKTTDPSRQKVSIQSIEVIQNGTSVLTVTQPDQMITVGTLPVFNPGDQVTVKVTAVNSSPSYNPGCFVFLHHLWNGAQVSRERIPLTPDGTFIRTWTIRAGAVLASQFAVIDVLDSKCLQDQTEDDYNCNAWGLPYKVRL